MGRRFLSNPTQSFSKTLTFNTADIATGVFLVDLPANAFVHSFRARIWIPWNSTTAFLVIGIGASPGTEVTNGADMKAAWPTAYEFTGTSSFLQGKMTADRAIYAKVNEVGGPSTTGDVRIDGTFGIQP